MEFSEILPSIIEAIPTIVVAVSAFVFGRYNSKSDKTSSILEEQYLKVISPIHRALRCGKKKDVLDVVGKEEIDRVIAENYHLLPDGLYDDYIEYTNGMDVLGIFIKKINEYNRILRSKLGYSKIRLTKDEKVASKHLAKFKDGIDVVFNIISALILLLSLLVSHYEEELSSFLRALF